jgi:hypothetical protein
MTATWRPTSPGCGGCVAEDRVLGPPPGVMERRMSPVEVKRGDSPLVLGLPHTGTFVSR